MIKTRKSQGLSINAIIIAVIALVVLVVLIAIFTGRIGIFSKGVSEVNSCEQVCKGLGFADGYIESDAQRLNQDYITKPIGAKDSNGNRCACLRQTK